MDGIKQLPISFQSRIYKHKLQILIFFISILVIILRRPDAFFTPQFWAEDGPIFFATAYNHGFGLSTLFSPYAGYFQFFPRALSLLGGFINLKYMPLVFTLAALTIQVLPLVYLWGRRADALVKSQWAKLLISIIYLCMPFTQEISSNATNSQWYLVVSAFIILFLAQPKNSIVKVFDYLVLLVAGLSGPFSIFLAPLAFIEWYLKRQKVNFVRFLILAFCTIATCINLLLNSTNRGAANLGVSVARFLDIVGAQVYAAGLFGTHASAAVLKVHHLAPSIALVATAALIYICIKAPRILWMLVLLGSVVLLSSLFLPAVSPLAHREGFWQIMLSPGAGGRYYFLLHLAIFLGLVWGIFNFNNPARYAAGLFIVLSVFIGISSDFRYTPEPNLHYQNYAYQVQKLKKGQSLWVPINPQPGWGMLLTKQ